MGVDPGGGGWRDISPPPNILGGGWPVLSYPPPPPNISRLNVILYRQNNYKQITN